MSTLVFLAENSLQKMKVDKTLRVVLLTVNVVLVVSADRAISNVQVGISFAPVFAHRI